nr:uncharacterized protein LOC125423795 [Ziziphus jujuba var. spinosa]
MYSTITRGPPSYVGSGFICWQERGWLRGGKSGSLLRLLVGRSMRVCREDLTGKKIRFIIRMLLSCLEEDELEPIFESLLSWVLHQPAEPLHPCQFHACAFLCQKVRRWRFQPTMLQDSKVDTAFCIADTRHR